MGTAAATTGASSACQPRRRSRARLSASAAQTLWQPPPPAGGPHGSALRENGRALRLAVTGPETVPEAAGDGRASGSPVPSSLLPPPQFAVTASQPDRLATLVFPPFPATPRAGSNHRLPGEEGGEGRTTLPGGGEKKRSEPEGFLETNTPVSGWCSDEEFPRGRGGVAGGNGAVTLSPELCGICQ